MNVYYSPEDMGYHVLDSLDQAGAYEFDSILFAKRDRDGAVFVLTDSGCSCPVPFDDLNPETDGERVRTTQDVERAVMTWWDRDRHDPRWGGGVTLSACRDLIRSVSAVL